MMAVKLSPTQANWLVVRAEPVASIDVAHADTLEELARSMAQARIMLCFAETKDPVKDKLKNFGLFQNLEKNVFSRTWGGCQLASQILFR